MSLTYTQLKTAIQDYAQNTETSFVTHNDDFIRAAENNIYRLVNLTVTRKQSTDALTASTEFFTVPTGFISANSFAITVSSKAVFLLFKDRTFMREAYPNADTEGVPKYYSIRNSTQLIVAPTPDSAYVTDLDYFHIPETIITDTNTWLGDNAEEALLRGCMIQAMGYLKSPEADVIYWTKLYDESIAQLKEEHESKAQIDQYAYGSLRLPPS